MISKYRLISVLVVATFAATSVVSTTAWSVPGDPQTVAREHYKHGKELYDAGQFADALIEFQAAYDAKPHPVVLKSISECKVQLGDVPGALELLNQFLEDPAAQGKEEVYVRIDELRKLLAVLEITSEPGGAYVTIDGTPTHNSTPTTIEVGKGDHQVTLTKDGYEPIVMQISVAEGERKPIAIDFAKDGTLTASAKKEAAVLNPFEEEKKEGRPIAAESMKEAAADERAKRDGLHPMFWVCAAVTGVGLVGGTVFGTMALGAEDEYKKNPSKEQLDTGKRDALISDISFGVAAAAAITGTVILIMYDGEEKAESSAKNSFKILPVAGGESIGVNTTVTF